MERNIDSFEGNCGEASLKIDGSRLGFRLFDTFVNDLNKMSLDIFQRHTLHESGNVNVLSLQVVEQIGEAVKGA